MPPDDLGQHKNAGLFPPQAHSLAQVEPEPSDHSVFADCELGLRLKTLRELYGLSQRELAKRAAITNSNISMIEQGQVSPSVHSLGRILSAFPVSLETFFGWNFKEPLIESELIVRAQSLPWSTVNGVSQASATPASTAAQLNINQLILPPSGATVFALPAGGVDLAGKLLAGEVQLMIAAQVYKLYCGDSFYIHANQTYRFINSTEHDACLLCCSIFGQC